MNDNLPTSRDRMDAAHARLTTMLDPVSEQERATVEHLGKTLDLPTLETVAGLMRRAFLAALRDGHHTGREEARDAVDRLIAEVAGKPSEKFSTPEVPNQRPSIDGEPTADSYWHGHEDGVQYAEQSPKRLDVPEDAHTLRALLGPPTVDELVRVAAWAGISTTELVEIRDGQPLDREELRQLHDWVDEMRMNVERLAGHVGVECRSLGSGQR